jgi:Mce-associated membrane protein
MTDKEPEAAEPDAVEADAAKPDDAEPDLRKSDVAEPDTTDELNDKTARRRVTVSVRSLVIAVVIVAFVGAVAVLGWLYMGAQSKLDAQARQSEDNAHAEKVALDYAVNAAAMDFQDINAWKVKLVTGTTPELNDKLSKAATSIEQILVPLQWTSTAKPLVAKVHSHTGSTYVVDAFVSVMTKTVQAPDPLQSTATYSVTLDSSKDWKISDVGGIGAAVEEK